MATQTFIKNIHLISEGMKPADIDKMEAAAIAHRRHSNITFKIIDVLPGKVIIQVVQGKSAAENYFPAKRLIDIVHETFDRFFPGKTMNVHPIPYKEPAPAVVSVEWINRMMFENGIKLKTISDDTGIPNTQISAILNGHTELSLPMKALFWYYFLAKGAIKPEQTGVHSGFKLAKRANK